VIGAGPSGLVAAKQAFEAGFDVTVFEASGALVCRNGISGLEIASDVAMHAPVISGFRKPRYVIQTVVDGVSSHWQ
jgi:flavin-dependent dehydrogenase